MAVETEPEFFFHYLMRILMTADIAGTKPMQKSTYNPIPKVKMLLLTMAELDPGLTVTTFDGKVHCILAKTSFRLLKWPLRNSLVVTGKLMASIEVQRGTYCAMVE